MSHTATIHPSGMTPNAKIPIRTTYAAASCRSVAKIACKDVEKCDPRDARALRVGFSLILGLGKCKNSLTLLGVLAIFLLFFRECAADLLSRESALTFKGSVSFNT